MIRFDRRADPLFAVDLRAVDLLAVDLLAVDLLAVDLLAVDLRAVDLLAVDLRAVDLRAVDLRAVDLRAVDLRAVDLRAVGLRAVDLLAVDLRAVDLRAVDLRAVDFVALRRFTEDLRAVDFDFAVLRLRFVRLCVGIDVSPKKLSPATRADSSMPGPRPPKGAQKLRTHASSDFTNTRSVLKAFIGGLPIRLKKSFGQKLLPLGTMSWPEYPPGRAMLRAQ